MNRLAIFDCDGTLVDSGGSIHRALGAAFAHHGLDLPERDITKKVIGLSLHEAMATLVPDGDHAALTETYKQAFFDLRGAGQVEEPLYDGIIELIERLENDDWLLGVATGKSRRGLDHCLASHGLEQRFVTLQTADTNPSKPNPAMAHAAMAEAGAAPETTVFIGDTAWDMGCARAAGCCAIGAAWGYHDHDELVRDGAHHIAQAPLDVVDLSREWIAQA